jgi:hypothetical protein
MRIDTYSFGSIVIDGRRYTADVIILPDRVIANWWRKSGHSLVPDDLLEIIPHKPDRLIIGTGSFGVMKVPPGTLEFLGNHGIEPVVMKTGEAVKEFNRSEPGSNIAAALHLTC